MKVTQVKVKNTVLPDFMVCWLSGKEKFKLGSILSLDGVGGLWRVEEIYTTQEHYEIRRGWDNNI